LQALGVLIDESTDPGLALAEEEVATIAPMTDTNNPAEIRAP